MGCAASKDAVQNQVLEQSAKPNQVGASDAKSPKSAMKSNQGTVGKKPKPVAFEIPLDETPKTKNAKQPTLTQPKSSAKSGNGKQGGDASADPKVMKEALLEKEAQVAANRQKELERIQQKQLDQEAHAQKVREAKKKNQLLASQEELNGDMVTGALESGGEGVAIKGQAAASKLPVGKADGKKGSVAPAGSTGSSEVSFGSIKKGAKGPKEAPAKGGKAGKK